MSRNENSGFRPDKRLGQHFLNDRMIIDRIIGYSNFSSSDRVLEIGPGQGALTIPLASSVDEITAVEKDTRLIEGLKERIEKADIHNIRVINRDILKFDFSEIANSDRKIKVIGNLPYNISSPLLGKLIDHRDIIDEAVLMFQAEFAERLTAEPGCKQYGSLTVMTRYRASVSELMNVSRDLFFPKPKVGSMVVRIDFKEPCSRAAKDEDLFKLIVRGSFAQRRKTIINSLRVLDKQIAREKFIQAMETCGIDPGTRAETLSLDDFICLSDELFDKGCNRPPE